VKGYTRTHHLISRANLRLMGIEEGVAVQAKGIHNIFNKIIAKFPKS
jgi:hypothetical protein